MVKRYDIMEICDLGDAVQNRGKQFVEVFDYEKLQAERNELAEQLDAIFKEFRDESDGESNNYGFGVCQRIRQYIEQLEAERDSLQQAFDLGVAFHDLKCAELDRELHLVETLEARLLKAEQLLTEAQQSINDWMVAKDKEEARAIKVESELSRLREAVPEKVITEIKKLCEQVAGFGTVQWGIDTNPLLNLIGSLLKKVDQLSEFDVVKEKYNELKAKMACSMGVGDGHRNLFVHGDYESIKACEALIHRGKNLEAENKHLKTKLKAVDRRIIIERDIERDSIELELSRLRKELDDAESDIDTTADMVIQLQQELNNLRESVPEEVDVVLEKYYTARQGNYPTHKELKIKLMSLIGSLITTSREKRQVEIEAAYVRGHFDKDIALWNKNAKAYATRIIEGQE